MLETITNKISDEIQNWILSQKSFIGHLTKIFSAIFLTATITNPGMIWSLLSSILSWNHYSIAFFLEFMFAIYYITPIVKREMQGQKKDELLFFGASLEKVTEYLMRVGTFKRDDIEREFGISRVSYYDMVRVMDEVGIFIRGENNTRRVDVRLTKTDIINLLSPPPVDEAPEDSEESEKEDTESLQSGFVRTAIR